MPSTEPATTHVVTSEDAKRRPGEPSAVETLYTQSTSATPSSTLPLARALAMLQQSAAGAVFPRAVTESGALQDLSEAIPPKTRVTDNVEYTLMARMHRAPTSCLEASRRYAGAKSVI